MKNVFLLVFLLFGHVHGQNIYFSTPVETDTLYTNSNGTVYIGYEVNYSGYTIFEYYAKLKYPDGSWSDWQSGLSGGWWVTKAGTYQIQGKAYATNIFTLWTGWIYQTPFSFQVVDNYSPATPSNFSITTYNNAPKITWSANTEQDFDYYEIWRQWDEGGTPTTWALETTTTSTSYVDNDFVINGKPYAGTVYYKIRAVDINDNESGFTSVQSKSYTNTTWKRLSDLTMSNKTVKDYSISNYPNPYNPATNIFYQLPEDGHVSIKVYDMLGREIKELVNGFRTSGRYEVRFDGSNLASSMYIYQIIVNAQREDGIGYSASKKMLLLK